MLLKLSSFRSPQFFFFFFRINTLARNGTSPRAHARGDSVFARENVPRGLFEGAGHVILSHSCF